MTIQEHVYKQNVEDGLNQIRKAIVELEAAKADLEIYAKRIEEGEPEHAHAIGYFHEQYLQFSLDRILEIPKRVDGGKFLSIACTIARARARIAD